MIQTGVVSVTFRNLQPAVIVEMAQQAGLSGIEWGGDVHVPHGNVRRAKEVRKMTLDAGLQVSSYGSYYKVGRDANTGLFEKVLETAVVLKAPSVRVWAGDRGSDYSDAIWWHKVVEDSRRIAAQAAEVGITIAFEYHEETLTDTSESACRLLCEIGLPNVLSYWQPRLNTNLAEQIKGLRAITPWLGNLHVFNQCGAEPGPLAEGAIQWSQYLDIVRELPGDRFLLLEFVKGDSPSQFLEDAETLRKFM
jgi:sugar phosphate isomerase/epimerase